MNKLTDESIKYIVARLVDYANDALIEYKENPNDDFYAGKRLAYYEMLNTLKNELEVREQDLKEFGLDIDLDKKYI